MIDNAAIVASDAERLMHYCPDLASWPRSWLVEPRDIAPGQRIVSCFTPFLLHLFNLELSRKTLRVHRDNLWALGGEIIRDLHEEPRLRDRPIEKLLLAVLDEQGGPLLYHQPSEQQQRSFDCTCRRFYRFLQDTETQAR